MVDLRQNDKNADAWKAFTFNVPGLTVFGGQAVYEYKLPYIIQSVGFCARMSPWCYIFDVTCCKCLSKGGPPTFMDMVDQETGDQVRYRSQNACCRPPRVMVFRSGTYLGHASRTMRCLNRCRTCLEDLSGTPVNMVGLHDANGGQVARIERNARKCCVDVQCNVPMKCIGCCFYCVTCTISCQPSEDPIYQGKGHWCCCGHGVLACDPICCEGIVRGPNTLCMADDVPCLCIGVPGGKGCCEIYCPMATFTNTPLETTSTIRLETHNVVQAGENRQNVGMIQFQYRGNFPSSYTHDPTKPLTAAVGMKDSGLGLLASTVVVGKVYELGAPEAAFHDLPPRPEGRSPGFDGWVICKDYRQMESLQKALRDDLVVEESVVLGDEKISGVQVRGWVLTDMGYVNQGTECCGRTFGKGETKPKFVGTKKEYMDILKISREGQIGDKGMDYVLRFRLRDLEKKIAGTEGDDKVDPKFDPFGGGFATMLDEVACACVCTRVWKFPCNTTQKTKPLCKIPLYAQKHTGAMQVSQASPNAPVHVVMNSRNKDAWPPIK